MYLFDSRIVHHLDLILHQLHTLNSTLGRIERTLIPRTTSAAITFTAPNTRKDPKMANPGNQTIGSTLLATFTPIEADGVTPTPGTTLTTPPTWTISDSLIATLTDNGNGTATITGVAAGTVTVTATAGTFTDSDGTVVGPLDASNTDTVTAPTGRTVSAQIVFG